MIYEFVNQKNSKSLASRCRQASNYWSKLVGLIGKTDLKTGEGLWFPRSNSIHMWFMKFPIDAVFVKNDGETFTVTKCYQNLKPWKLLPATSLAASDVIELPVGAIQNAEIREGDRLCISLKS